MQMTQSIPLEHSNKNDEQQEKHKHPSLCGQMDRYVQL